MALLLCAASACSSDSGTPNNPVAPTIASTIPADAANEVAVNAVLSGTFDRPMAPLGASAFTLKQGDTAVAGTVSTSTDGLTATFTPTSALAANTTYVATVAAGAKSVAGGTLADSRSWTFNTVSPPVTGPQLLSSYPSDGSTAVPINVKLTASFDVAMTALTGTTFTLKQGSTPVAGTVTNSADGITATFTPSANLAANTTYTGTITTGATSSTGTAFAAERSWSFTTGAAADTTPPVVTATNPAGSASGVPVNTKIAATFNKPMDPLTIVAANFTVKQGGTPIAGTVSYGPGITANFKPTAALPSNVLLTAEITTGAKDLLGNALASAFTWTFTTGTVAALGPAPVLLGAAGNFVILAKTAISTVPPSVITGDIGVSPAAATFMTGFSLVADATNVFSTSPQITGKAYAANYAVPTPSNLTTSVSNMEAAYTDAASRPTPDFLELGTGNIGGKTLAPGLYKWTSAVTVPSDVTISGGANDVWIFQTTGNLTMAAGKRITLAGGAQAKNIFWQVAGKVVFGASAHFEGILLCKTEVTMQTSSTMNGRILAQTQVALQKATVTKPAQ